MGPQDQEESNDAADVGIESWFIPPGSAGLVFQGCEQDAKIYCCPLALRELHQGLNLI